MLMYAYLGAWNSRTKKPIAEEGWITPAEAQTKYDELTGHFEVVPYAVFEGQSRDPRAGTPWTVRFYSAGEWRFRSTFFDDHGSIYREIWYQLIEGRLFKSLVSEFTYPYAPDDGRQNRSGAVVTTNGSFAPDGTGTLEINDKSQSAVERLSIDQIDVSGHWLDVPAFGEWAALADPDFGNQKS